MRKAIEKIGKEKWTLLIMFMGVMGVLQITGILTDIRSLWNGTSATESLKLKNISFAPGIFLVSISAAMFLISRIGEIGDAISKVWKK